MNRTLMWAVWSVAAVASAAPKTLVVGAGDCSGVELVTGLTDFGVALRPKLKADLYEADVVLDIVRPRPTRTLDDVQRQVESARTLFYNGQNERALDLLKQALSELERAPISGEPWKVMSQALTLKGVVLLGLGKKAEALEAFRTVLRVEPAHTLSKDDFTPSVLTQFEVLRKELSRVKKVQLQVQSSTSGADVLVEGRLMGVTPLTLSLAPSSYRLLVRAGDRSSYLRVVTVPREGVVQVDLEAEGALATQAPLCLNAKDKGAESAALKLANTVTADDLILVRREGPRSTPGSFVAARYEIRTGSVVREGRVQAPLKGKPAFPALAEFLLTGQGSSLIVTPDAPTSMVVVEKKPGAADVVVERLAEAKPPETTTRAADLPSPPTPPPPPPVVGGSTISAARVASFVMMGVGAGLAVTGVVLDLQGDSVRARYRALLQPDGRLPDPSLPAHREALGLAATASQSRLVSWSVLGAGVGVLAAGVVTLLVFPGTTSTVAVVPGPDGAAFSWTTSF
ncbi:MAG: PEGA domain-containing protein [Myxococcaceae bacterium]|nr:PEGA domain-containing protein [Myxococcaceae bacterium]